MKGLTKCSTGFLFPFLLAVTLASKPQADPIYPKETVIFYSNGMLTTRQRARLNLRNLEIHLKQNILHQLSNFSSDELTFELAYNHSFGQNIEGGIDDLHEAIVEQLGENSISQFWRNINLLQDSGNPISAAIAVILRDLFADLVVEYEGTSTLDQQPEIQQHVDKYNQLLKGCKRLILFGHSQGAIVSNIAHTGIEPTLESAIAVMGVGTPDSYVAGEGNFYTNLEEDLLVQSIPGALPGNVDNYDPFTSVPGVGHALIGNYIDLYSPLPSEDKIVDDLVAMIEQVQSFSNIEYCGWPAIYGNGIAAFRRPAGTHRLIDPPADDIVWDKVWQAALDGSLQIQFRIGYSGGWSTLTNGDISGDSWAFFHTGSGSTNADIYEPYVFINNVYSTNSRNLSKTVEVQIDDNHPGINQYRLIIDNQVIEQFTLYQPHGLFSSIETSRPISDIPINGTLPLIPIP